MRLFLRPKPLPLFIESFRLKENDTNKMPTEYLLPGYVAECCKLIGIEGIKFYGSEKYVNYVSWENGYFEDAGMCAYPKLM